MSTTAANSGVIIQARDNRRLSQNQDPQTNTIINSVDGDNNQDSVRIGGGLINFPQQNQRHSVDSDPGSSPNLMITENNNNNHHHTDSNNNTHDNNDDHHQAILMAKTSTTTNNNNNNKMLDHHHHQNPLDYTDNNNDDGTERSEKGESSSQADNEFCTCCIPSTGNRIPEENSSQTSSTISTAARCNVCDGIQPRRRSPESNNVIDQEDDNFENTSSSNNNSDMFETNADDDDDGSGEETSMMVNNSNSNPSTNNNDEEKDDGIQSCNNNNHNNNNNNNNNNNHDNNNRNGILISNNNGGSDQPKIQDSSTNNTAAAANDSKIKLPSVSDSALQPTAATLAANTITSAPLTSGSSASSALPSVVNLKSNKEHILGSSLTTNSSNSSTAIDNNSSTTPILSVAGGGCSQSESNAGGGDSPTLPSSLSSKINQRSQLLLIKSEPESPPPNKQRPIIIPPPPPPPPPHPSSSSSSSSIQSPSSSSISSIINSNSGGGNSTTPPTNNESNNNHTARTTPTAMLAASNGPLQAPTSNQTNMMDYHSQAPPPPPPSLHHHQQHQPSPQQIHGHGTLTMGGHQMSGASPQTLLPMLGGGNNNAHHPQQQPTISVAAVVTAASSSPSSDPKDCIEEMCPVCGDRVSGYHYGLLTCESCKGFFKRTVQNKKVYTCVADRSCHIDKSQRKRCPFCRFQKCLDVGMKLEAVRADRMRGGRNKFGPMYKRDRARRLQLLRQKQLSKAHHMGGGGHSGGHHAQPALLTGSVAAAAAAAAAANEARNFLNTNAPGSHGGASSLFGDGVKPELIQIPQLSSSTSSPDSSPSPGSTAVATAAQLPNAASGGHHFMSPLVPSNLQTSNPLAAASGSSVPSLMNTNEHILKWGANGPGPSNINTNNSSNNNNNNNNNNNPNGGSSKSGGLQPSGAHYDAGGKLITPQLIRELQMSMPDDKEWQSQLFGLLQNQTYNQCEVDLFELMCKVIDQSLFAQVDWARNSIFFKELKVDDQMKLLQNAWSDMLVLDHIHQRLHAGLPDETTLPNGQKFDLLSLALLGVPQVADQLHRVTARLSELKVDTNDYICLKFLLLLNPEVRGLTNFKLVLDAHEQTKQALLDYCINFYPQITDKFNHLLSLVPEIHGLTLRGEDFLYFKHMNGSAPTQTLLMEMLHAKKK